MPFSSWILKHETGWSQLLKRKPRHVLVSHQVPKPRWVEVAEDAVGFIARLVFPCLDVYLTLGSLILRLMVSIYCRWSRLALYWMVVHRIKGFTSKMSKPSKSEDHQNLRLAENHGRFWLEWHLDVTHIGGFSSFWWYWQSTREFALPGVRGDCMLKGYNIRGLYLSCFSWNFTSKQLPNNNTNSWSIHRITIKMTIYSIYFVNEMVGSNNYGFFVQEPSYTGTVGNSTVYSNTVTW